MSQNIYKKPIYYTIIMMMAIVSSACQKEGIFTDRKQEVILNALDARMQAQEILLSGDSVYRVTSNLEIGNGEILTIDAGTLIKIDDGYKITIAQGGKIFSKGTAERPVVFTSSAAKGGQGVFLGNTYTCWAGIEVYGRTNQSSGQIQYTRIEFPGYPRSLAGLYLNSVDSTTTIDHVQVSNSYQAPSYIFSGGQSRAKYLVSNAAANSDFIFENGHTGKLQFLLAYRVPLFPDYFNGNTMAGLLFRQNGTAPSISNATVIGPDGQPGTSRYFFYDTAQAPNGQKSSVAVTDNSVFRIANSSFLGFPMGGIHINSANSAVSLQQGLSSVRNTYFHSNDTTRTFYLNRDLFPGIGPQQLEDFLLVPGLSNKELFSSFAFGYNAAFEKDSPDLTLTATSVLSNAASFTIAPFNDPFFLKTNFIGAFGADDWMKMWTNFIPLQTNYNN